MKGFLLRFRLPTGVVVVFVLLSLSMAGRAGSLTGAGLANLGWIALAQELVLEENVHHPVTVQDVVSPHFQGRASARALTLFGRAIVMDPKQSSALRGLVLLSAQAGDPSASLILYQRLEHDSRARPTDYLLAGEIAYSLARRQQALYYWLMIGADEYYFRAGQYFSSRNSSAVQYYAPEERLRLAEAAFERVFLINPQRQDALCPAGEVAYYLEDYAEARQLLEAGSAFPLLMSADCYAFLGYLCYSSGEISNALQAFERAGDLGNINGYMAIGWHYRNHNDCTTAEVWFRRAAAAYPTRSWPWVSLSVCALDSNQLASVERFLLIALEREADDPGACYYLGNLALRRGQVDEANERLQAALKFSGGDYERIPNFWAYLALGDAYLERGNCDLALAQYQIAARIHPDASKAPVAEAMNRFTEHCRPSR